MRIINDSECLVHELIEETENWYESTCPWSSAKLLESVPKDHPWLYKAFKYNAEFNKNKMSPSKINKDVALDVLFGIDLMMDVEMGDDYFSVAIDVTTNSEAVQLKLKKNQDPIRFNILTQLSIQHHLLIVVESSLSFDTLSAYQKSKFVSKIEDAIKSLKSVVYLD